MNCRTLFLLSVVFLPFLPAKFARAEIAPGDYDGDGISDLAEARVNVRGATTQWNVRLANGAPISFGFSAAADGFVIGRFVQDKLVTPGIVTAHKNRPLDWKIKTPSGGEVALQYGFDGDILPNLGDLDCDGITDITVVRNNGRADLPGMKVWYTALSSTGTVIETVFGNIFDRVATADVDGDNCAELIVIREGFHWFSKKLSAPEIKVVQWGLPGDIPLFPTDINNDGSPDYITVRATPGGQFAYVRLGAGSYQIFPLGSESSIPAAGHFGKDASFAFFSRNLGTAQIAGEAGAFTFASPASTVIRPDGGVVESDETGKFIRADNTGLLSSTQPFDDAVELGCGAPKTPDGKNKKRAWLAAGQNGLPGYYLSGKLRSLEIFSAGGKLIDRFNLVKSGGKSKRELWGGNVSALSLSAYAPILLKETTASNTCNWIDIANPNISWD